MSQLQTDSAADVIIAADMLHLQKDSAADVSQLYKDSAADVSQL